METTALFHPPRTPPSPGVGWLFHSPHISVSSPPSSALLPSLHGLAPAPSHVTAPGTARTTHTTLRVLTSQALLVLLPLEAAFSHSMSWTDDLFPLRGPLHCIKATPFSFVLPLDPMGLFSYIGFVQAASVYQAAGSFSAGIPLICLLSRALGSVTQEVLSDCWRTETPKE